VRALFSGIEVLLFMVGTSSGTFGFSIPSVEANLLFTVRVLVSTDASVRARRLYFLLWRNSIEPHVLL